MSKDNTSRDFAGSALWKLTNNGAMMCSAVSMDVAGRYIDSLCGKIRLAVPGDMNTAEAMADYIREYASGRAQCLSVVAPDVVRQRKDVSALLDKYRSEQGGAGTLPRLARDFSASGLRTSLDEPLLGTKVRSALLFLGMQKMDSEGPVHGVSVYHSWFRDMGEMLSRMRARLLSDHSFTCERDALSIGAGLSSSVDALRAMEESGGAILSSGGTCGIVLGTNREGGDIAVGVTVYHVAPDGLSTEMLNVIRPDEKGTLSVCSYEGRGREDSIDTIMEEKSVTLHRDDIPLSGIQLFPDSLRRFLGIEPAGQTRYEAAPAVSAGDHPENGMSSADVVSGDDDAGVFYDGIS